MLADTAANRALVNRGIALRDESVRICESMPNGDLMVMLRGTREMIFRDYTRDLNTGPQYKDGQQSEDGAIEVCLMKDNFRVGGFHKGTDLRWLVAMAVWEAVKQC